MDALGPVPEHLVGYYDVVHVARIGLHVQHENPKPLIQNFMKMLSKSRRWRGVGEFIAKRQLTHMTNSLEPGGFLQWEELDIASRRVTSVHETPHPYYDQFIEAGKILRSAQGLSFECVLLSLPSSWN